MSLQQRNHVPPLFHSCSAATASLLAVLERLKQALYDLACVRCVCTCSNGAALKALRVVAGKREGEPLHFSTLDARKHRCDVCAEMCDHARVTRTVCVTCMVTMHPVSTLLPE